MPISFNNTVVFCLGSIFLAATTIHAECICTPSTGTGSSIIGFEYAAKNTCSVTLRTDSMEYQYNRNEIECSDEGKVVKKSNTNTVILPQTPNGIYNLATTILPGRWFILRNTFGTHFILVNDNYKGNIVAGVNMSGKSTGVLYNLGPALDTYCTLPATPDWNSSGIPDCLKPDPIPARNNGGPPCPPD